MALKKRISYQAKILFPLISAVWVMLIAFAVWQYNNMQQYQVDQLRSQLAMVNARIIDQYEHELNVTPFLDFIKRYFIDNPDYEEVRVTIYKDGVRMSTFIGEPIALSREEYTKAEGMTTGYGMAYEREILATEDANDSDTRADKRNLYAANVSRDGRLLVYSMSPITKPSPALMARTNMFLIALFVVALSLTIFLFFSTRFISRSIKNLHTFAKKAADGEEISNLTFPHDELGEISNQIVELYEQRVEATQRTIEEHTVAMNAIEERARNKRQLTNNINHELRTPIGVIKGYLDTLAENPDMDPASRAHFISKAQQHVNRLVNLIADVSAITRLEEGSELVSTEELNFHDLAFTVSNDLQESGALKGMQFTFSIPLNCMIDGNYNLLSGVLTNLAKNAANYSKGTTIELLTTGEDEDFYYFSFRDDGVGVGEEHIPHLFERFYRVDSGRARKAGGTGLGLPIVYSTINVHGGEIKVQNRTDGETGLEFLFNLRKYKRTE